MYRVTAHRGYRHTTRNLLIRTVAVSWRSVRASPAPRPRCRFWERRRQLSTRSRRNPSHAGIGTPSTFAATTPQHAFDDSGSGAPGIRVAEFVLTPRL